MSIPKRGLKMNPLQKYSNATIYKNTNSIPAVYKITKSKFNYARHIVRETRTKWSKLTTIRIPHDSKRKKGRPATRWRDEIVRLRSQ